MPKISTQLQKVVTAVAAQQQAAAQGVLAGTPIPWSDFAAVAVAGKFDTAGFRAIFTRAETNTEYAAAKAAPTALAKDVQAVKIGGDILAGFQRDATLRNRSRIQSFAHAAARARANGLSNGAVKAGSVNFLARLMGESKV